MSDSLARLELDRTVLLVVDPQEKLLPAVLDGERVVQATRLLLRAAQAMDLPVIASTQYLKGLGPLVEGVEELLPKTAARIDKTSFSCFDADGFQPLLRELAPRASTLLVTGIETHICVAGTVLEALRRGFNVQVVTDATSARTASDVMVGLRRMEQGGALLTSAEMAVYELMRGSDAPAFKQMLPWLRGDKE